MDAPNRIFPRSLAEADRLLTEHEQATGYRTMKLVEGTYLARHPKSGGIAVTESDRPILVFLPDGRIQIRLHAAWPGRVARISACLPDGWSLIVSTKYRAGTNSPTTICNVLIGPNDYRKILNMTFTFDPNAEHPAMPGRQLVAA
jgi:hypothetical protein